MVAWEVGAEVVCPRCGKPGRAGVDRFRAKGHVYEYRVIRHYEGGRVRRCVISRAGGPAPAPAASEVAAGPKPEAEVPEGVSAVGTYAQVPSPGTSLQVPAAGAEVEVPEPPVFTDEAPLPEELDRASWYIMKVSASWGSLRENPTEGNLRLFERAVRQVEGRLGVPVEDAIAAADYYVKARSERARILANEAVKRLIARLIIASAGTYAQVPSPGTCAGAPEVRVEVPKELLDAVSALQSRIDAIARDLNYVKEQVRQRKGPGARAVARGEKKIEVKEGNLYWMVREVLRTRGDLTKEEVAEEIARRFGRRVSGNSLSGRLSELAAAGLVAAQRRGRRWTWRWVGP